MILQSVYIYKKIITQAQRASRSHLHVSPPKQAIAIIPISMNWIPLPPVTAIDHMYEEVEIMKEGKLYDLEIDGAGTLVGFKQLYK